MDIAGIAARALARAEVLVPQWLPGGKRRGAEWVCGDLSGEPGESCSVNLHTGKWSEFAADVGGGDLVSLYAAIHRLRQGEAARDLAALLGDVSAAAPEPPPRKRTEWVPVVPAPPSAGPPPMAHVVRGPYEKRWEYRGPEGALLGLVYRFRTSDGGKEVVPCVWARHPRGAEQWRWLSFPEPRPLYWPARAAGAKPHDDVPVLVVEGEKCADAAHAELGAWYAVVSWPGGGKAADKADWRVLSGRTAVLWPDCDAQRDKAGELLPLERQPGVVAMAKIASLLAACGCRVQTLAIPAPGERPNGWDVADAIAEGLRGEALREWIAERLPAPVSAAAPSAPPVPPAAPPPGGGGEDSEPDGWWHALIRKRPKAPPEDCRENVLLILDRHPDWRGAIGWNAFAARTESRRRTPWGTGPGEWTTRDDRELGLWLAQRCGLLIRAEANLHAGVEMMAERAEYHPVLDYVRGCAWDGTERLPYWLSECCGAADTPYTRAVGAYFLRSMVARVVKPGAQVDHMLVLEGAQGRGKSSALRILGGEWFSDTQLKLGDKEALLQLAGVWLYEVAELDAFSRADVTAVKAFLTSLNDNVRGVYERRSRRRPRQVVMAGTTNQAEYLRDMTGNRRFWPVAVEAQIDTERLAQQRDLLFAEAYASIQQGARWWPSRTEEAELFVPAQDERVVADPWIEELPERLQGTKWIGQREFTVAELLHVLGVTADKIDPRGEMARRITLIMRQLGWQFRVRRPDGSRPRTWSRPLDRGPAVVQPGPAPGPDSEVPL